MLFFNKSGKQVKLVGVYNDTARRDGYAVVDGRVVLAPYGGWKSEEQRLAALAASRQYSVEVSNQKDADPFSVPIFDSL